MKKKTITKIQLWKKTKDEVRNEGYLERESWRTGQRRSQRVKGCPWLQGNTMRPTSTEEYSKGCDIYIFIWNDFFLLFL